MSHLPLVSVVIPTYNYGRYLGGAIDSALAQSYPNIEVIAVDDGSRDESDAVLRRYGDRVRWVRQSRQGVSAARNRGVQESRGELVAFLDADDFWFPVKLERQVARWRAEPQIDLVHCGARMLDEQGRTVQVQLDGLEGWIAQEMLLFRRLSIVCAGSAALVTRKGFDAIGGFDPRLSTSADWDLCYRLAVRKRVGFVPEELVVVRIHQTNMHANIRIMEHDMLLAYAKAFQDAGPAMRRLRRQSYGNLHIVLGGSFFRAGQPSDAIRHLLKGLWLTPANATRVLEFPVRWWRRRGSNRHLMRADHRPRILYLSYDGVMEPLGQSQVLPYLRGLAAQGAMITLLSFEKRADRRGPRRISLRQELAAQGIRWVPLAYHKRPTVLATSYDVLVGTCRAWWIIRRDAMHVVHARSYVAALMAWRLKRILGVRFLFDMRGFWADERVEAGQWSRSGLLYRLAKRLERVFLQEADEVVVLTERASQTIEAWLGPAAPRVTVIPTCVDLERFAAPRADRRPGQVPVFVYAGSVAAWYLLPEMLRFMERAVQRFPGAQLMLLTRQAPEAAAALRRSPLPPGTVSVASVEAPEIPQWLSQADAGLAFYQPGFSRRGTCPTKIGEYLAAGLPVVVSPGVGDTEALLQDAKTGVVLPACTPEAYDRALEDLRRLWGEPTLAARCRGVAKRHSALELGIERYRAIYERLDE